MVSDNSVSHVMFDSNSLNPCFSGRWSLTWHYEPSVVPVELVLILVLVEDGL